MKKAAPEFKQVYNDSERLRNNSGNLNVKYSYDIEEIRYEEYRGHYDLLFTIYLICRLRLTKNTVYMSVRYNHDLFYYTYRFLS